MANSLDLQTHVGRNLSALALICERSPVRPDEVLQFLHQAVGGAYPPFSEFEKPLLRIQSIYNRCIELLRKFEQSDRAEFHEIICRRTQFHRYKALLPLLEQSVQAAKDEIQKMQARIRELPSTGNRTDQKRERERLIKESSTAGTKLGELKRIRDDVAAKATKASSEANLRRLKLSDQVDIEAFKNFEDVIRDREELKAKFFLSNSWTTLLLDCKVQNAFDAILRAAAPHPLAKLKRPTPLTWWQLICCCRRPTS